MKHSISETNLTAAIVAFFAMMGMAVGLDVTQAYAQEVTVLRGGTVIDGTGAAPVSNAAIVVRGDRIEAIGQGITPPPGATAVDVTGKYITPGLWDKHLHYKSWMPELLITNGVTSGYAQEGGPWIVAQKE